MILPALLLPALLGYLLARLLVRDDPAVEARELLGIAFPLGAGVLTLQMFLLGLARVPLRLDTLAPTVLAECAALAVPLLRRRDRRRPVPPAPAAVRWDRSAGARVAVLLLGAWASLQLASVLAGATLRPIHAWDAWANWSAGAKAFHAAGGLLLDEPPPGFFGGGIVARFTAYPLHNPLLQVWTALWIGRFDEVLVKLSSPLYLLSAAGLLHAHARREAGRLAAAVLLVMFLSSPLLSLHATELYSDLPLGTSLLSAAVCLFEARRGRPGWSALAGIFLATALFTKDEALFFVLPCLGVLALGQVRAARAGEPPPLRLGAFLAPLLAVVPWFAFKAAHGLGVGPDDARLALAFHPEVLPALLRQLLSLSNFNVLVVGFPLLLAASGRPGRELSPVLAPTAAYLAFFLLLYTCTPYYHRHFSAGTVLHRNLLTAFPLLVLLTGRLLGRLAPRDTAPDA